MAKAKLLLDENIGRYVTLKLRQNKYNVESILERGVGSNDETVLALAVKENRIIVTLDKDFGTLVHLHFRKHAGVILLRLDDESPQSILKTLFPVLKFPNKNLKNKFIVVTETKIRVH